MHGLSQQDLEIRRRARELTDTLIPYEVEAGLAGGVLPAELTGEVPTTPPSRAASTPPTCPRPWAVGASPPSSRCLCKSRSAASPTVSRGACTPRRNGGSRWRPRSRLERWLRPTVAGHRHECYAITEEFAGTDVSDLATTAQFISSVDGDDYVVNGTKWHVTSYNLADYCFVQAVLTGGTNAGEHVLLVVDLPQPRHRGGPHAGVLPQHRRPPPDRVVHRRAGSPPHS